eukprot:1831426-Prymnesium_polylepis.1
MRRTTDESLAPYGLAACASPSEPSSPSGTTHDGRTGARQLGTTHVCSAAPLRTAPSGPMWPQHESSARPAPPSASVPCCAARTFSKKRSERTRPVSSFCSRRSRCTWSRTHAI